MKKLPFLFIALLLLFACTKNKTASNSDSMNTIGSDSTEITLRAEILGVHIGKTLKDSALSIMKINGVNLERLERDVYGDLNGIRYAGILWDVVGVNTFNDTVSEVLFVKGYDKMDDFYEDYSYVSEKLKEKYPSSLIEDEDTATIKKAYIVFNDKLNSITLGLGYIGKPVLKFTFENNKLKEKFQNRSEDEI